MTHAKAIALGASLAAIGSLLGIAVYVWAFWTGGSP